MSRGATAGIFRRDQRERETTATSVENGSILVRKLLFSLRTERVSERHKRQTDRKDEADIVKLASVLPRSFSVNFVLKAAIALDCNVILSTTKCRERVA